MRKWRGKTWFCLAGMILPWLLAGGIFSAVGHGEAGNTAAAVQAEIPAPTFSARELFSGKPGETENERAHRAYLRALKENSFEKNPSLYVSEASRYSFYDIDGNGVDELLAVDGFLAISIFTYQDGKIIYLDHEKYGSNFRLYPEKGIIELPYGGHMDHYYAWFIRIDGVKAKHVAEKEWVVHYLDRKGEKTRTTYRYKLFGKRVKKAEYQKYVRALRKTKTVKRKELVWKRRKALLSQPKQAGKKS